MTILLTGATGYIGSHVWIELLQGSIDVVGIDSLVNSRIESLDAIRGISGKSVAFVEGDIRDSNLLCEIFANYPITHVVHLAALKSSQESMLNMDEYFDVNMNGLKVLLAVMKEYGCRKIIFSSSAAVYGDKAVSPIGELSQTHPANWYGETKLQAEKLLFDESVQPSRIHSIGLRYFNVAGRHSSGMLKDYSLSKAHSLFTEIVRVLRCESRSLSIFGDNWGTIDGTCIRDYVHVCDIAKGHIDALKLLDKSEGFSPINLGSGTGRSVKEVISGFERLLGHPISVKVANKRPGDVAVSYADCSRAINLINWAPKRTLVDMCLDSLKP